MRPAFFGWQYSGSGFSSPSAVNFVTRFCPHFSLLVLFFFGGVPLSGLLPSARGDTRRGLPGAVDFFGLSFFGLPLRPKGFLTTFSASLAAAE